MSTVKNIDPSLLGMLFGLTEVLGIMFGVQILEYFDDIGAVYFSCCMIALFNTTYIIFDEYKYVSIFSFLIQRFFVGIFFNLVIYIQNLRTPDDLRMFSFELNYSKG